MAHTISQSYINAITTAVREKTVKFEPGSSLYEKAYSDLKDALYVIGYQPQYADPALQPNGTELPNPDGKKALEDWTLLINTIYTEDGTPYIDAKKKFQAAGNQKISTTLQLSQFKTALAPFLKKHRLLEDATLRLDKNAESRYQYAAKQIESNDVLQADFDRLYQIAKLALESKYKSTNVSANTLNKLNLANFTKAIGTSQFKIAMNSSEVPITYAIFKPEFIQAYLEEKSETGTPTSGLLTPSSTVLAQIQGGSAASAVPSPSKVLGTQAGTIGPITAQIQAVTNPPADLTQLIQPSTTPAVQAQAQPIAPNQPAVTQSAPTVSVENTTAPSLEELLEKDPAMFDLSRPIVTQNTTNTQNAAAGVPNIVQQLGGGQTSIDNSTSSTVTNLNSAISTQTSSPVTKVLTQANSAAATTNSVVNSLPSTLISEINKQIDARVNQGIATINSILTTASTGNASAASSNLTQPDLNQQNAAGTTNINQTNASDLNAVDNTVSQTDLSVTNKTMLNKNTASQIVNTNPVSSSINTLGKNITENTTALNSIKTVYQSPAQNISNSNANTTNSVDNSVIDNSVNQSQATAPVDEKKKDEVAKDEGVDMSQIYLQGIYDVLLNHGIKIRTNHT